MGAVKARGKEEQGHGVLVSFNWQFGKAWSHPGGRPVPDHLVGMFAGDY